MNVTEIQDIITDISVCDYIYTPSTQDYQFTPQEALVELNSKRQELNNKLNAQIRSSKINEELCDRFITTTQNAIEILQLRKDGLRVNFILSTNGNLTNDEKTIAKEKYNEINSIIFRKNRTLTRLGLYLTQVKENYEYILEADLQEANNTSNSTETELEQIDFEELGKATFNLDKKKSITLILLLEKLNIISFNGTSRNKFIERNFNYTTNQGTQSPLKRINSEISNLKDKKTEGFESRNKKSIKDLIEIITSRFKNYNIDDFFKK